MWVASSKKVRDRGWVLLAQMAVCAQCWSKPLVPKNSCRIALEQTTFLVSLYHLNELVQQRSRPRDPPTLLTPPSLLPSQTASYLFISLFFSVLHYSLYALVVGIRRRVSPNAGRSVGARGPWEETTWHGTVREVRGSMRKRRGSSNYRKRGGAPGASPLVSASTAEPSAYGPDEVGVSALEIESGAAIERGDVSMVSAEDEESEDGNETGDHGEDQEEEEEELLDSDTDNDGDVLLESSDDENEIIDIRRRGSRMSMRPEDEEMGGSRDREQRTLDRGGGELRSVSKYGSISTLGKHCL